MRPTELDTRDRLKGTLVVLAWLALAILLRDWNRVCPDPSSEPSPALNARVEPSPAGPR